MTATVGQLMACGPVLVDLDAPATEAARLMRDHDTDALVVVSGGEVRGLVSERDILVRGVAEFLDRRDFLALTVRDICTRDPVTVSPADSVRDAVRLMHAHGVHRLPVADHAGRAVGVITLDDVATAAPAAPAAPAGRPAPLEPAVSR